VVPIVLGIGVVFGLMNGLLYTVLRVPSLMVTLGTWSVGLGIASLLYPGQAVEVSDQNFLSLALDDWLGLSLSCWVAIACLGIAFLIQRYSRFSRNSYALGGGEQLALLSGINARRLKIFAFTLAGICFAIAAMLATARSGYGNPNVGEGVLFTSVASVAIGGTLLTGGGGGVLHSTVGVLIIAVLGNGMVLVGVDPYIQSVIHGALIISAVVVSTWFLRSRMRVVK